MTYSEFELGGEAINNGRVVDFNGDGKETFRV